MSKEMLFFGRLDFVKFHRETSLRASDEELGKWARELANNLLYNEPKCDFSRSILEEGAARSEQNRRNAEARWRAEKGEKDANGMRSHNDRNASNSNSSSNSSNSRNNNTPPTPHSEKTMEKTEGEKNIVVGGVQGGETPPSISPPKKITPQELEKRFREQVEGDYSGQYSPEMLEAFSDYWTEPSKSGRLRYEMEKTWEVGRRLKTWSRRSEQKKATATERPKTFREIELEREEEEGRRALADVTARREARLAREAERKEAYLAKQAALKKAWEEREMAKSLINN